jgi:hypothetical protein
MAKRLPAIRRLARLRAHGFPDELAARIEGIDQEDAERIRAKPEFEREVADVRHADFRALCRDNVLYTLAQGAMAPFSAFASWDEQGNVEFRKPDEIPADLHWMIDEMRSPGQNTSAVMKITKRAAILELLAKMLEPAPRVAPELPAGGPTEDWARSVLASARSEFKSGRKRRA